jgi:hypothetical protein
MSAAEFQQRYSQLTVNTRGGDDYKLQTYRTFISGRSLTSAQVKQFAVAFTADFARYQFALEAFPITSDKENFYDVYDAFTSFSTVFRLHDALRAPAPPVVVTPVTPAPNSPRQRKPGISYPQCNNYTGRAGCTPPLSDRDFDYFSNGIFNLSNDNARINASRELMNSNCITTAQLMQLVLAFDLDANRLSFMKESLPRVFDLENYNFATVVFGNDYLKNDWLSYARNYLNPPPPSVVPAPVCEVTLAEFDDIKATIKKQSFSSSMLSMAKQIITSKKCFTVAQITQIVKLFSFDGDQLDIAKFAYDFTIDKPNYYKVTDALSFSSSKDDLLKFISLKK